MKVACVNVEVIQKIMSDLLSTVQSVKVLFHPSPHYLLTYDDKATNFQSMISVIK